MTIKAVIFDIGGVCVGSPIEGIHRYEEKHNLPRDYINVAIVSQGEGGAFQRFERGEIKLHDFYKAFGEQLSDPKNKQYYQKYLTKTGKANHQLIPDISVNGQELFHTMMAEAKQIDPYIFQAIQQLKKSKRFILAALTNNFEVPKSDQQELQALGDGPPKILRNSFDHYVESTVVGLRKPDPRFYLYACKLLGIEPHEAVFLDDIGGNLRTAKELGMQTIQVKVGRTKEAVKQLEKIVQMDLLLDQNSGDSGPRL
ncbi:HAD-like domain-containing protein [Halteromyces radiatus]|uniref:HAD-like domain-containing protein n=1 Tax=Halteromyces radiatus TaxID=101107 RepID=UPI00221F384D|nr:HAD-like domain-containing protein [Halteromyces radiatus]KAI8085205.1 HAD-like domain-containing protein [Halteromyces radiatus]